MTTPPDPMRHYHLDPDSNSESASSRGAGDAESSSSDSPEPMDQDENSENYPDDARTVVVSPPSPEPARNTVEKSEFEADDKPEYFELWSSDATSPDEDNDQKESSSKKKSHVWSNNLIRENIVNLTFTGETGLNGLDTGRKYTPLECFKLFVDDDLINLMVKETNRNARASFIRYGYHEGFLSGWMDVTFKEMTQFIGLMIFMSLKRHPETSLYWSTERLYFCPVACRVFTQTRFHRILAFWHFGTDGTDDVYAKINPVFTRLNNNFLKYKQPGNILYVGKSRVHLRNKYIFEPQAERYRKATKLLKIIDQDIYTYKLNVMAPETVTNRTHKSKSLIINLLDGFLDQGRLIIFHNLFISLDLAQELLKRKSHCIGMIRKNCRGTPKEIEFKKLEDGELSGLQNQQGISVMKWQHDGDSYFGITTCHTLEMVTVQKKVGDKQKDTSIVYEELPRYLRDISLSEKIFDAHDKYTVNASPVNDQMKWYQRLASDTIINAVTTNAYVLYKQLNKEKLRMWDFRDKLFRELVDIKQLPNISSDEEAELELDE